MDEDDDLTLDGVILQIFEEQADSFSFPLTTPKQARDFVRVLNRKGFNYEMLAEEMGEKLTYFQNWRLGTDSPEIYERVVRRLNLPLQDAMLSDDEDDGDPVRDKVKQLLFNGMSIDLDDAEAALEQLDDRKRKKILEAARKRNSITVKDAGKIREAIPVIEKSDSEVNAEVSEVPKVEKSAKAVKQDEVVLPKKEAVASAADASKASKAGESPAVSGGKKEKDLDVKKEKDFDVKKEKDLDVKKEKDLDVKKEKDLDVKPATAAAVEKVAKTQSDSPKPENIVLRGTSAKSTTPKVKELCDKDSHSATIVDEKPKSSPAVAKTLLTSGKESKPADESLKSPKQLLTKDNALESPPALPKSPPPTESSKSPPTSLPLKAVSKPGPKSPTSPELEPPSSPPPPPPSSDSQAKEKKIVPISPVKKTQSITTSPTLSKTDGPKVDTSVSKTNSSAPLSPKEEKTKTNVSRQTESNVGAGSKTAISWMDSVDSSTASESESSTSSSISSKSKPSKTDSPKSPTATLIPTLKSKAATPAAALSKGDAKSVEIDENYDSDLDWSELDHSTPQAKLIDSVHLFKSSVEDGPGYVYAFSDTTGSKPIEKLTGTHRIKIGASRYPQKRLEQAKRFNADLCMLPGVKVKRRRDALCRMQGALAEMSFRGLVGWYRGPIDKILQAFEDLEK